MTKKSHNYRKTAPVIQKRERGNQPCAGHDPPNRTGANVCEQHDRDCRNDAREDCDTTGARGGLRVQRAFIRVIEQIQSRSGITGSPSQESSNHKCDYRRQQDPRCHRLKAKYQLAVRASSASTEDGGVQLSSSRALPASTCNEPHRRS